MAVFEDFYFFFPQQKTFMTVDFARICLEDSVGDAAFVCSYYFKGF